MTSIPRLVVLAAAIAMVSCGGSAPAAPTSPTTVTAPPLTITAAAPTLGAELNSGFIAAMQSGVPRASRDRGSRADLWTLLIEPFVGVPLHAQGGFLANCSSGGNIRVQYLGAAPGGGRVTLANTPVALSACSRGLSGRNVVANGTLSASGSWSASEPSTPVRLSGELKVDEIGTVPVDGATGVTFLGAIGGVAVGAADTPPPPNPTTPACPTPVPTPQCPATPPPAPLPVSVTGSWRDLASPAVLVLTQTGSAISGSVLLGQTAGATVVTNTISGSVSGSNVTMTWVLALRSSATDMTITTTATSVLSMVLTSDATMSGPVTTNAVAVTVCTGPGSEFCPPPIPVSTTGSASYRKQ